MLTLRVPEVVHDRLSRLAEERQVPISTLARSFLVQAMNQEEDPAIRARALVDAIEQDRQLLFRLRRLVLFSTDSGE